MKKITGRPSCWYGEKKYAEDKDVNLRLETGVSLIKNYCRKGVEILDIGGYTGELLNFLPQGIKFYLIDFDKEALKLARKKGIFTKELDLDNDEIKWDKKKFDIVIATEILEHLKDPERHLEGIKKILKPNGVVLISLPNECTLYHRLMVFLGKGIDLYAFKLYKHLHFPTIQQSEDLLKRHFRIIKKKYYFLARGKGSQMEKLGALTGRMPPSFWQWLVNLSPTLFARGTIFLCAKK